MNKWNDPSASRSGHGGGRTARASVLSNQKVGRRPRQSATSPEAGHQPARRVGGARRFQDPWHVHVLYRLFHAGAWWIAVVGLGIKWLVELFTGDDRLRQSREVASREPLLDDWEDGEPSLPEPMPVVREVVPSWSENSAEAAPPGLQDFESLKIATLEAEERELSEDDLADQAASLRARLEKARNEA